jgi:biopolymer transport protein TolQ
MDPSLLPLLDADLIDGAVRAAQYLADGFGGQGGEIELAQAKPEDGGAKIKGEDLKKIKVTKVGKDAPTDFSLVSIILRADVIVKAVIVVLALASIWSWAVIFDKLMLLRRMKKRASHFEAEFWSGGSVDDLYDRVSQRKPNPMAGIFMAAMREWRKSNVPERSGELNISGGVQERIDRSMQISISREMEPMERQVGFLATIGSTAPFIGLFGTVWGIMNSFREIAVQKNTNLATVAPGISEALFATALGLVAAIPAVVAYNILTKDLDRFAQRLEGFAGEFSGIVSRQIDSGVK